MHLTSVLFIHTTSCYGHCYLYTLYKQSAINSPCCQQHVIAIFKFYLCKCWLGILLVVCGPLKLYLQNAIKLTTNINISYKIWSLQWFWRQKQQLMQGAKLLFAHHFLVLSWLSSISLQSKMQETFQFYKMSELIFVPQTTTSTTALLPAMLLAHWPLVWCRLYCSW